MTDGKSRRVEKQVYSACSDRRRENRGQDQEGRRKTETISGRQVWDDARRRKPGRGEISRQA